MVSKLLRRTHLYLALFLTPWVLMYAVSTFVMNHRDWFQSRPPAPARWEPVREFTYEGEFAPGAKPREIAVQLLSSLGLDGRHTVNRRDDTVIILRQEAIHPLRVTYTPKDKKVVVERMASTAAGFLNQMHRRRGYGTGYAVDTAWAFSVDLFIAGVLFWALSGLWMWWEMKLTRGMGAAFLGAGVGLFALFLAVL